MRSTVSSSLIALQLLCAAGPAFAAPVQIEDLGTYGDAMNYASSTNILSPMNDGLWHPEAPLTRMDLITSVVRSVYKDDIGYQCFDNIAPSIPARFTNLFKDVSVDSINASEICTAMFVGILQGRPDGSLRPDQSANLVDAAKMITKAYGIAPFPGLELKTNIPWHESYWYALAKRDAIPDTVKSRNATLTRGEYATIMYALRNDKPLVGVKNAPTFVKAENQPGAGEKIATSTVKTDTTPVLSARGCELLSHRESRYAARVAKWDRKTNASFATYQAPSPLL